MTCNFRPHEHYFKDHEFYFPTGFGRSFTINMKDLDGNLLHPNENIKDFMLKLSNKISCELTFSGENELGSISYKIDHNDNNEKYEYVEFKVNKSIFVMKHTCSSHSGSNDEFKPYNKTIQIPFESSNNMINQYINIVNNSV